MPSISQQVLRFGRGLCAGLSGPLLSGACVWIAIGQTLAVIAMLAVGHRVGGTHAATGENAESVAKSITAMNTDTRISTVSMQSTHATPSQPVSLSAAN